MPKSLAIAVAALSMWSITDARAQVTEAEAHAIGVEAYTYFYPLLSMEITRKQFTNVEPGKEFGKGPMNMFVSVPEYPPGDFKGVVRSNFDTLYSIAWLDLKKEPMVISAPDTKGRYYLLPMLDMWTDVFASPGWRTTGTGAGTFLVVPQAWRPDLRDRFVEEFKLPPFTQRIEAPTPFVWIIGRTKTDGPADYGAVHAIQAGYKVTPLSEWGKPPKAPEVKIDPSIDMKTPPKIQVDTMPVGKYFASAAQLMMDNPPHSTDQPIVARMKRIGIEPGKAFDIDSLDPAIRKGLQGVAEDAQKLMEWKIPTIARVANYWSMNTDTMGVYGNYYLKRAIVAQVGLGANLPEDAIYPLNLGDQDGRPLEGTQRYVLHFDNGATPPTNAFWSITLYDSDGFQVPNALNRFAVSSWMPFQYNADGSLDLYIQNDSPGAGRQANWLPAPKGPFNLTMRIYGPKSEALTGRWNPPAITRVQAVPALVVQ
ncbi:membrane protein [Alsobacter metallidurans]|uniref:Membrane protein n=2 Tax=Alsobacter metallidurans TaxID=340221 RepID=A0A917IAY0_9HYPH|nr:membrane protein [Alsobacter metallidurans]